MANYTKTTDFAAKDSYLTGNPDKLVKGTELDTEFNNIANNFTSKYDSNDIASANEAQNETLNTKIITPLRLSDWSQAGTKLVGQLHAYSDPGADRILFWDDGAAPDNRRLRTDTRQSLADHRRSRED
jgi:hypothetical protein